MRSVRFYKTEEAARAVEPVLAADCGVSTVFLYKCRDHEMFMASDEDSGNFLRHRHSGTMYNSIYWDMITVDKTEPRVYPDMARMYSREQQILQSRLVAGSLSAAHSHIYSVVVGDDKQLFAFDVYQGDCAPVVINDEQYIADYHMTFGQSKLIGRT